MNTWYTAQELAGQPGLPATARAIRSFAQRAGWSSQRRIGSKASEYAFASLPTETKQALLAKIVGASQSSEIVERDAHSSSRLNDKQRSVMAARLAFIREIEHLSKVTSQRQAIALVLTQTKTGELSPYLAERLERANDRKTSGRNLSERTLKRWISDYKQYGEAGLAPARRKADVNVPEWAAGFLRCYQRPTKPSVEASYAEFASKHSGESPSIHQVRRFLNKLSIDARELGRCSAQEAKAHKAFNRRSTLNMLPGEVYTADGHTFDAEVLNQRTGKPYRPEITTVIDVATRRALGFSVGEAESHIVVLDALRDAVQRGGMFVMFYVDNGPGYKNSTIREVVERLGGSIIHALPYNSQARGLIERAHQTIWVNAAKKIPSYLGADMDRHAGHKVHKITRKQLRESGSTTLMPTFDEFRAGAETEIEAYNRKPHRGLPKIRDPKTFKRRHMTPLEAWDAAIAKGWEPLKAPPEVVNDLLRPQVVRKTHRGEISWAGERYALEALGNFHGKQVRVAYDVRDASRIWVRTMAGEMIGEAKLNGNSSDYIAPSIIEQGYVKQAKGQFKQTVAKLESLTGKRVELVAEPVVDYSQAQLTAARQHAVRLASPSHDQFKLPSDSMSRYRLWHRLNARQQSGESLSEEEALWHQHYPKHPDYQAIRRVFEHAMPAR